MSDAVKHIADDIFSGRQRIGAYALCVQHSPTAAALATSCLLNHAPQQPRTLITRFRESLIQAWRLAAT